MPFINKIMMFAETQQGMRVNNERPAGMFILMVLAILFAALAHVSDITCGTNYELFMLGYTMCNFALVVMFLIR